MSSTEEKHIPSGTPVLAKIVMVLGITSLVILLFLFASLFFPLFVVRYPLTIFIGFLLSLSFSIVCIILGHIVRYHFGHDPNSSKQKTIPKRELVVSYCCLAFFVFVVVAFQVSIIYNSLKCAINMYAMEPALACFASENPEGFFPQLSSEKGRLIFKNDYDGEVLVSADSMYLNCPYDLEYEKIETGNIDAEECIRNCSYCYLGYIITNDTEMRAFAEAYKKRIAEGLPFDTDLEVPPGTGTGGSDKIYRFRIEMSSILKELGWSEEQLGSVPLIWDRCVLAPDQDTPVHRHPEMPTLYPRPTSILVKYYDWHNESLRYGEEKWPMTEETLRLFWELENL